MVVFPPCLRGFLGRASSMPGSTASGLAGARRQRDAARDGRRPAVLARGLLAALRHEARGVPHPCSPTTGSTPSTCSSAPAAPSSGLRRRRRVQTEVRGSAGASRRREASSMSRAKNKRSKGDASERHVLRRPCLTPYRASWKTGSFTAALTGNRQDGIGKDAK